MKNVEVALQHLVAGVQYNTIVKLGDARVVAMVHKVIGQTEHTLARDDQLRGVLYQVRGEVELALCLRDFLELPANLRC